MDRFAASTRRNIRFGLCVIHPIRHEVLLRDGKLWRKDSSGCHKLVATPSSRYTVLVSAHDDVAHKGFYATHGLIAERFWWPAMRGDIAWFIRTCRLCQLRQTHNVLIPPVVANPAPLFAKVYIHRHDAPSQVKRLQVYSTGPLFTHALCRVPCAACGNSCDSQRMVIPRHLVKSGE